MPCIENAVIREDNHILNVVSELSKMGLQYYWTWLPIKCGYEKFEEGIGLMSLSPVIETDTALISGINDYKNWKTRKIAGICTEKYPNQWFYSVHYGWWNDSDDTFENQWKKTLMHIKNKPNTWLMGDFNNPSKISGEGYDMMMKSGFYDSFTVALQKDSGITVNDIIDGWKDKITCTDGMRIDYILSSFSAKIKRSQVIFNGKNYPVVSDHCGVIIECEEE